MNIYTIWRAHTRRAIFINESLARLTSPHLLGARVVEIDHLHGFVNRSINVNFEAMTDDFESHTLRIFNRNSPVRIYFLNSVRSCPSGFQLSWKETQARVVKQDQVAYLKIFSVFQATVVQSLCALFVQYRALIGLLPKLLQLVNL